MAPNEPTEPQPDILFPGITPEGEPGPSPLPLSALAAGATPQHGEMTLPGWNDVIHLVPDSALPEAEQVARKRIRARNIAGSPSTQLSKSVTWLMTQIDNIQDGLVTLSVGLRLVGLAIPGVRPAAELTGKAADWLNIGQVFKAFKVAPTSAKRHAETSMKNSTGYYHGRVKAATNLRTALPNIAEALQILQTSDQLTGVGLSLGAIMGQPLAAVSHLMSPQEIDPNDPRLDRPGMTGEEITEYLRTERPQEYAKAGTLTAAYGLATVVSIVQPQTLALSITTETLGRLYDPSAAARGDEIEKAAGIMDGSMWLSTAEHDLSAEDHLMISLAYTLALAACILDPRQLPTAALAPLILDKARTTRPPRNRTTRLALQSLGINPDDPGPLPLRGNPTRTTTRDAIAELSELAPAALPAWRANLDTDDQRSFANLLHTYQARAPWQILEGPYVQMEHGYTPKVARSTPC